MYFLSKYTTNKAQEVVKGFLTWDSNKGYEEARKLLAQRFGNPFRVAEAYKAKLRNWPQIVEGDSSSLQDFSDFLARCEGAMQSMKYMEELNSTRLLQEISKKLPLKSGSRWCRQAHDVLKKTERTVSFHDLVEFVREEADLANDPVFSPEALKGDRDKVPDRSRVKRSQGANSFVSFSSRTPPSESRGRSNAEQKPKQQSSCIFCGGNHLPHKCGELSRKSIDERLALVRSKGLCFGCLKRGHQSKNCRARLNCEKCGKQHPTPLHDPTYKERSVNQNTPESSRSDSAHSHQASSEVANDDRDSNLNVSVCSAISGRDMVTNSLIIPVYVFRKGHPELKVKVYALLDDASDTTFIKTVVKDKLGIPGVNSKLILSTMLGSEEITVCRVDGLVVERIDQRVQVELPRTYSRDQIPSRRDQIPSPEVAAVWPHLQRIKDKIMPYQESLEIGLLIGCNCPKAIKPKEVILGKGEDPYAVRTLLGWGIIGPVSPLEDLRHDCGEHLVSSCNRILTYEVDTGRCSNRSFVLSSQTKEEINPFALRRMLERDFSEEFIPGSGFSKEDRRFLAIAGEGITQLENGHYELPLPLKNPNVVLPNNRESAFRRLLQLKRRFLADGRYRDDYITFMENVIEKGFAEKVKPGASSSSYTEQRNVWYIPHHGVYHPKKPTKIRVVFDCAAEFKGESLNKHLLQGPDLTNTLTGVLNRFRQEHVGLMCDIESMFYQVYVAEEYRDLLRFLWWENGDLSKDPIEYRMAVHLFGATSSPGCANFALKKTAQDSECELGSAAADFLRSDFYVDDGLKSCASIEEANHLIKSVKEMCRRGGFNLQKFISNKKEVLKNIPVIENADDLKNINLNLDKLPME